MSALIETRFSNGYFSVMPKYLQHSGYSNDSEFKSKANQNINFNILIWRVYRQFIICAHNKVFKYHHTYKQLPIFNAENSNGRMRIKMLNGKLCTQKMRTQKSHNYFQEHTENALTYICIQYISRERYFSCAFSWNPISCLKLSHLKEPTSLVVIRNYLKQRDYFLLWLADTHRSRFSHSCDQQLIIFYQHTEKDKPRPASQSTRRHQAQI